jgi:hypothetical protein
VTTGLTAAALTVGLAAAASVQDHGAEAVRTVPVGTVDITDTSGTISAEHGSPDPAEDVAMVIDNTPFRKYFTPHSTGWIQFTAAVPAVATGYAMTSANDAPDRNPRSWLFQAYADVVGWTTLDSQSDETFLAGFQKNTYAVTNTTAYRQYRLLVTATNGSPDLQLGEWQILGTTSAVPPAPEAPAAPATGQLVQPRSRDHVELAWTDRTRFETGYEIQRRTGSGSWATVATLPPGNTRYVDRGLSAGITYQYRIRAKGITDSGWISGSGTTLGIARHPTMAETLHAHDPNYNETVSYSGTSGSVAGYRTGSLAGTDLTWARDYVRRIWDDARATYGGLGSPQLYAVFHPGNGGGTARVLYDAESYYRNMIDVEAGVPPVSSHDRRNVFAHEIGHVVENSAYGVQGSPAGALWGDSKWCEIFQYDAYLGVGDAADAQGLRNDLMGVTESYPRPGTRWFANWFAPIYDGEPGAQFSGSLVLARFFQLLATHFHVFNGAYQRDLNWGEFVHFWSGAANVDLAARAEFAFGDSAERDDQLAQARLDFPGVRYAY